MSALHRTRQVLSSAVPEKWLQAVKKIPANARKENRKFAAFCGDKLLGAVLAQKLQSHHQSDKQKLTVGKATILAGTVLSNRFLADRLPLIVPNHNDDGVEIGTHSQGTIVEAAVAAVYDQDEEAVGALVEWLINEAPDVSSLRVSPKNELLDRGGKCAFTYRVGGPDHNPEFRAVVELNGETMSSTGNTKKIAEDNASYLLLEKLGCDLSTTLLPSTSEDVVLEPIQNTWEHFTYQAHNNVISLKDEESMLDWWDRGAHTEKDAFRRAMMAPHAFPELIVSVDSWTRRMGTDAASLIVLTFRKDDVRSCHSVVEVSVESATKARAKAAMEINRRIAELRD